MTSNPPLLQDQVALVTGAAGEIGRVIATDLLRHGARVVWTGMRLQALRALLPGESERAQASMAVRLDVRREADIRRVVARTVARFGKLDILINNAAVRGPTGPAINLSRRQWHEVIETNLTGPFLCARECLKPMMSRRQGVVINISSIAGRIAYPLRAAYASSKWGLIGLTKTLAQEAGSAGVRVNAICPGPVEGEAMEEVISQRARATRTPIEEVRRQFVRPAALGRMVTAQDVSRMVVFLCSDHARNITGRVIEVGAGFGLWPG